jgi:hypothetical protein
MAEVSLSLHPKQAQAIHTEATETLFGGAAGPGKSHAMRVGSILWASEIPGLQVYLFRRLYDDLIKNHMEGPKGYHAMLAPWVQQRWCNIVDDEIRFWNGSKIYLCHVQHEKNRFKYQGAEIHVLLIDELTHFTEVIYRFLRGRVRMVGIQNLPAKYQRMFPRILCGSNPGNIGHQWVKMSFIDGVQDGEIRQMSDLEGGMRRQFIKARLNDNPSLSDDDPNYEAKLSGLGNAALVKAMKEGDWNIVEGAFFTEWRTESHVLRPVELPKHWMRFRSGDWGSAKPYSFHWWAVVSDDWMHPDGMVMPRGAIVAYRELYGIRVKPDGSFDPDVGVKEPSDVVARKALSLEGAEFDDKGKMTKEPTEGVSYGVLDPAAFATISGPSIAETMAKEGLWFTRADNKRVAKSGAIGGHDQFRKRLAGNADRRPMIYFFANCMHAIRTIPVLQHDATNPEDIDTHMEDHCFAAGTLVETAAGAVPIEQLVGTEGHVLSAGGWQRYRSCRRTRESTKRIALRFDVGITVTCTPDHRFMTEGGWVQAQDMVGRTCIRLSYPTPSKNLTASVTTVAGAISSAKAFAYICMSGYTITAKYLMVITSIIGTKTDQITSLATWNYLRQRSTCLGGTMRSFPSMANASLSWPKTALASGTHLMPAMNGTSSTTPRSRTSCMCAWRWFAGAAAIATQASRAVSFAQTLARRLLGANPGQTMRSEHAPFAQLNSRQIATAKVDAALASALARSRRESGAVCINLSEVEPGDVYCLTVPETGCFAIEGGLLVSNCYDDSRYAAMSRPWTNDVPPLTEEEEHTLLLTKAREERLKAAGIGRDKRSGR